MLRSAVLLWLCLTCGVLAAADTPPEFIEGRVVDASGRPVGDVDVSYFWSANGLKGYQEGKTIDLQHKDEQLKFWGQVGEMEPWPSAAKKWMRTGSDGRFRVESHARNHHVVAMTADRTRGGIGIVPVGQVGQPVTVRLEPLVRVQGKIRGPETDRQPSWTHVYALRAEEPERPTDLYRVASCGSFAAEFSLLLPPGTYQLDAYNDELTGRVVPDPRLTLTGAEGVVDLGTLRLSSVPEAVVPRMLRVMAERQIPALRERIGQAPPLIHADDSRGVARDWQAGHAPGKWQVIEFWGMDCPACLNRTLPDLIRFQDEHAGQTDRFEIITVFMDVEGKLNTIARMDEALQPIVKHVWGGRSLPFPTLVDPSYRTSESWGLAGYGDVVLIDPAGKIVAGDLDTLRGILAPQ